MMFEHWLLLCVVSKGCALCSCVRVCLFCLFVRWWVIMHFLSVWCGCVTLSCNCVGEKFPSKQHLYNICTMLDQCRRHWADVVQMLYWCFVFAGLHFTSPHTMYLLVNKPRVCCQWVSVAGQRWTIWPLTKPALSVSITLSPAVS